MFSHYVSNIPYGTGNNFILERDSDFSLKARIYMHVNETGRYNWRFFFSNTVDSTFAHGDIAFRGKSGGTWRIVSASLAVSDCDGGEVRGVVPVTFDGCPSRAVAPDERFWSDEVSFAVAPEERLVWEWTLEGNGIPCTPDTQAPAYITLNGEAVAAQDCPLPALFGCDKPVKKRIAFMGDSITQGCATGLGKLGMWAGKISYLLGRDYAVWNLGLGFGRGSDAAASDSWQYKVSRNDAVVVCFGVNDLLWGEYEVGRGATAGELCATLERLIPSLQRDGTEVILATIPPFSFTPAQQAEWRCANLAIPHIAELHGLRVFDIESALDCLPPLGNGYSRYGAHPNGEGGTAVAEYFRKTFCVNGEWTI